MVTVDIDRNVDTYLRNRRAEARYSSFDYCYNYFQSFHDSDQVSELASPQRRQESCLQIAFYLASWGMLRGSSDLLQRSARYYLALIDAIVGAPPAIWNLDVAGYDEGAFDLLFSVQRRIRTAFSEPASPILVTKIMLGVFGCVPAFDTYFKKGLGVSTFGRQSLQTVRQFYDGSADAIESHRVSTLDFDTGELTQRRYSQAKVIDMIFFVEGFPAKSTSQLASKLPDAAETSTTA
jgi:hypothetical protein